MNFKEFYEKQCSDEVSERIVRQKVIRKGKRKIKFTSDKPNFKVVVDPKTGSKKEIRIDPSELRKRKKGARKGSKKAKGKRGRAAKQRLRSMKKRAGLGSSTSR